MTSKTFEVIDLSGVGCGSGCTGCTCDESAAPCGKNGCSCASKRHLPAVLLVDDDPEFLEAIKQALLATNRCRVLTATSAPEAAKVLRGEAVALVVADHYLGGRTGTGLLEHVRQRYPGVGRCLMSARATKTVLAGAINRARAHQYLPKSMAPHLLVKAVLRELHGGQSAN